MSSFALRLFLFFVFLCLSRGSVRSPEAEAADEQDEDARLEAERKLEELKRRRDDAESEEFERMRQKQQEAEAELEELKRKREERRKVLEEEERQRKQEEAEKNAREEVISPFSSLYFVFKTTAPRDSPDRHLYLATTSPLDLEHDNFLVPLCSRHRWVSPPGSLARSEAPALASLLTLAPYVAARLSRFSHSRVMLMRLFGE